MIKNLNIDLKTFLSYLLLISLLFAPVVFFGKTLSPNLIYPENVASTGYKGRLPYNTFNVDTGTSAFFEMPINRLVGKIYLKGKAPLWNPYQGIGSPLAAQYSTKVFFPYQILEDIAPYWTLDYFLLLRLIIAAFFTCLFLRLLGLSDTTSFLGGIFYGLSGSFVWFIHLEQFVNVAMMIPVCMFSLERLIKFRRIRYIGELGLALGFMLLAGQPETAIYVLLLVGAYFVFRVCIEKKHFLKKMIFFIIALILCLALAAILIFPFLEFITHSYNCHPAGGTMGVENPTRLNHAISILIPSWHLLPVKYSIFPHNGIWDFLGGYTGVLMLYLVLLGFFYRSEHRKKFLFFSMFGFFIVLKNFGSPLASWIGYLPFFDQSWSPRWAGCVWTFPFSCAAAFSLESIARTKTKNTKIVGIIFLLLICLIVFLIFMTNYFQNFHLLQRVIRLVMLPTIINGIVAALITLGLALCVLYFIEDQRKVIIAITLLAIMELWYALPRGLMYPWPIFKIIPFVLGAISVLFYVKDKIKPTLTLGALVVLSYLFISLVPSRGLPDRYDIFKDRELTEFLKEDKSFARIMSEDKNLFPNYASAFGIYDIRFINSLSPQIYQHYVNNHLMHKPHKRITDRLWFTGRLDPEIAGDRSTYQDIDKNFKYYSYLGVKYLITPENTLMNLPLIYDKEVKVYDNTLSLPRVYVADDIELVSDYKKAQGFIGKDSFNIRTTVALEENPPGWFKEGLELGHDSKAIIKKYESDYVNISARLKHNGIVVLTDLYYPGWKCYVDGKETKIYRINGLVRGIFLEKGKYDIEYKYEPESFRKGLLISLIALVLCGLSLKEWPKVLFRRRK